MPRFDPRFNEGAKATPKPVDARRSRGRRRFVAVTLLLAIVAGLWLSKDRWWPLVTSSDPYESTPAATFAVGSAGLVLPEARALGSLSAEQVADALGRVQQALNAAYLDPRLLVDHDPGPLLNLLAPDSAATVRERFEAGQYGTALVRLAPGTSLAAPPRVTGKITYQRVDWNGMPALDVTTNHVFVYAFARPGGVVVVHSETHWMFPLANNLRPSSRGMYLGRTAGYWHGMDCSLTSRGLTGPAPSVDRDANPEFHDGDPLDAYYDPNRAVDVNSGCR